MPIRPKKYSPEMDALVLKLRFERVHPNEIRDALEAAFPELQGIKANQVRSLIFRLEKKGSKAGKVIQHFIQGICGENIASDCFQIDEEGEFDVPDPRKSITLVGATWAVPKHYQRLEKFEMGECA